MGYHAGTLVYVSTSWALYKYSYTSNECGKHLLTQSQVIFLQIQDMMNAYTPVQIEQKV